MTVCIAAICEDAFIWGASDRMLTRNDDIQYEATRPKFRAVEGHIAVMFAGDVRIQTEIIESVRQRVLSFKSKNSDRHPTVEAVVGMYSEVYEDFRRRHFERAFLSPFGLTTETFISRQKELSDQFVLKIEKRIFKDEAPDADAIIAGFDGCPHIWVFQGGEPRCEDHDGFAAIGSGSQYALPELERIRHGPSANNQTTEFMVYLAKRSAERIAGVGPETDMFSITFLKSGLRRSGPGKIKRLEGVYRNYLRNVERARRRALQEQMDHVKEALRRGDEEARKNQDSDDGNTSSDNEEELRGGPTKG